MSREFLIESAKKPSRIFLQDGFWNTKIQTGVLHKHDYVELHLVAGGVCRFALGKEEVTLEDGQLLAIPAGVLHCCRSSEQGTRHTAFQVDLPVSEVAIYTLSSALVEEFFCQIEKISAREDYGVIASFVSLLCSYVYRDAPLLAGAVSDERFLIREFFTHRYSEDVHLSDLAAYLHRSERQTERLLLVHTGRSFREELTHTRMEIAHHLLATTSLSLRQVSEYVGYRSYAGFWKAMRRGRGDA